MVEVQSILRIMNALGAVSWKQDIMLLIIMLQLTEVVLDGPSLQAHLADL